MLKSAQHRMRGRPSSEAIKTAIFQILANIYIIVAGVQTDGPTTAVVVTFTRVFGLGLCCLVGNFHAEDVAELIWIWEQSVKTIADLGNKIEN